MTVLLNVVSDPHADFTGGKFDIPAVHCDAHIVLGDAAAIEHALPFSGGHYKISDKTCVRK